MLGSFVEKPREFACWNWCCFLADVAATVGALPWTIAVPAACVDLIGLT